MLDKLKNTIKDAIENGANRMVFDPTRFDDPLATQIRWTPIKGGGSNFRTHKYYNQGANQAGFKATLGAKAFSGIFMLAGLGVSVGVPFSMFQDGESLMALETLFVIVSGWYFSVWDCICFDPIQNRSCSIKWWAITGKDGKSQRDIRATNL